MTRKAPYAGYISARGEYCVYCGALPSTDEHFPPYSLGCGGFIFRACAECNRLAGTNYPCDFEARAAYVKRRLNNKYRTFAYSRARETTEGDTEDPNCITSKRAVRDLRRRRAAIRVRLEWDHRLYFAEVWGDASTYYMGRLDDLKNS